MLSYPLPEAETLLISKLETAQQSLANCEDDVDFLREQITVCCYFITIKRRKEKEEKKRKKKTLIGSSLFGEF